MAEETAIPNVPQTPNNNSLKKLLKSPRFLILLCVLIINLIIFGLVYQTRYLQKNAESEVTRKVSTLSARYKLELEEYNRKFIEDNQKDNVCLSGDQFVGEVPVLTPLNRTIAFLRNGEIWEYSDGNENQLTNSEGRVVNFKYSPSGNYIFYIKTNITGEQAIATTLVSLDLNTKIEKEILKADKEEWQYGIFDFDFSSDGNKLAVAGNFGYWIIDLVSEQKEKKDSSKYDENNEGESQIYAMVDLLPGDKSILVTIGLYEGATEKIIDLETAKILYQGGYYVAGDITHDFIDEKNVIQVERNSFVEDKDDLVKIVNLDNTNSTQNLFSQKYLYNLTYSAPGKKIFYIRENEKPCYNKNSQSNHLVYHYDEIAVYDLNSGTNTDITSHSSKFDYKLGNTNSIKRGINVSGDGQLLAYEFWPKGGNIWITSIDGKTDGLLIKNGKAPAWKP